jgi:hypothetical protein
LAGVTSTICTRAASRRGSSSAPKACKESARADRSAI